MSLYNFVDRNAKQEREALAYEEYKNYKATAEQIEYNNIFERWSNARC